MKKYISTFEIGESEYKLKDSEVRTDLGTHEENTDIHVTAAEKEYWNSKVNPPSYSAPTAKSLTYTGEPQALLNAGSSTAGTIQYSIDQSEWSTNIPQATNAGIYFAYWRFIGEEVVYIDSTAIEVTISKANPAYTAPSAKSLIYNGNSQELINAGESNDGTFSYSADEETWVSSIPQATNAGEHTSYWKLTGDANHNDVVSTPITTTISKVTPTVTAPVAKTGLVYSGLAQTLADNGSTNFGTLQYSSDGQTYTTSVPQAINAGEHTVYYKVVGDSNVNDVAAATITTSIAKVTPNVTAPTPRVVVFDGTAQELITAGSTDFGTMQYKVGSDSWSTNIPTRTNGGSYELLYKVVGDSNINDVPYDTVECSISEKEITATVELSQDTYIYDGLAKTPSVTVKDGSVIIDPSEYSVSYSNNINAGTATVSVYDNDGGDYNVMGSATFTITKTSGSVTTDPAAKSLTYSGSAQTLANAGSGTGTMYYSLNETSGFSTTIPTETNAGNYTVYYYAAESANYNQSATDSILVTIAKANGSVTTAPTAKSLTYNGETQTLANAGSGTGTMYYSLNSSSGFSTTIPTGTNATSYTVYYYAAESSNYKQSATGNVSVSIGKADPTYTAPTAKSLTYSGSSQVLLNAGSTSDGTIQYSSDNSSWSTTIPTGTNANTYTSYWRIVGDSNHKDKASASISTTIGKANQNAPTATGATTTYSTTATASASGGGGQGSIEWSNGNTQTSVGSKTTQARWSGNSNYNASAWSNSVTLTMNKASGSVTTAPTNRGVTYNGSNQNLVNAGSGTGTMYYSLNGGSYSASIPQASAAGSYTVYYYAAASTNYNQSSTGSLTATIGKANQNAPTATGATVDYGSTATATASGGGGQGSIEWSNGNTRTALGSQSTQARWSGNSNYNASGWSNSVTLAVTQTHMGYEYVDLGLPSGTKWAKYNVGATSETGYGNFYQYGKGSATYNASDSAYTGTEDPLSFSVDTARQTWGGSWHMPTKAQCDELTANTTFTWTTINGVNGGKFTASNGNYIFIPAAGHWNNSSYTNEGSRGFIFSSSPSGTSNTGAFHLYFSDALVSVGGALRRYGSSVRPVLG